MTSEYEARAWLNYRHPNRIREQDEGRKDYYGTQTVLSFVEKELSPYLNRPQKKAPEKLEAIWEKERSRLNTLREQTADNFIGLGELL